MPEPPHRPDAAGRDGSAEPAGPAGPAGSADTGEGAQGPRSDDGLDLARALTRATAGSATTPVARTRRRRQDAAEARRRRDPQLSGSHPDDRDPQPLGSTMEGLVAEQGWGLELRVRQVFARWGELVGEQVGDHTTPESFADGRLVVRADSTAWATQLRLLAPALVRRLDTELGQGTVTLVEVLGPHRPARARGRRTRDSKGPGDTYG